MARTQSSRGSNPQAAGLAAGRGLLIVLFAVAIGVLLLARAVGPDTTAVTTGAPDGDQAGANPAGQPAPVASAVPSTTASTIPPKKEPQTVVVLVANGRGVAGAAKANADALKVQNYNLLSPVDFPSIETSTTVYFRAGYQADALAVAKVLTIDVSKVKELPASPLPIDVKTANVVVVLGTDGQGLMPS